MGYLLLIGAILAEVAGTTSLKLSEGFSRPVPSVLMFVFYGLSFTIFSFALKRIDVSVGYAIWSAVGTAAITAIGVFYFREPWTALKFVSMALIIGGVIGLNIGGGAH
ncbi:MAG: multidrug efflux SMR transporter [Ktedonobacterales bacterium]|nr:multidrug efflux SMR transporter [Ktedonobacterales bacterium]